MNSLFFDDLVLALVRALVVLPDGKFLLAFLDTLHIGEFFPALVATLPLLVPGKLVVALAHALPISWVLNWGFSGCLSGSFSWGLSRSLRGGFSGATEALYILGPIAYARLRVEKKSYNTLARVFESLAHLQDRLAEGRGFHERTGKTCCTRSLPGKFRQRK